MKKISIIVPVFNEEATVGRVIESLLRQNLGDWQKEIIIVNDGSTDNTQEVVLRTVGRERKNTVLLNHPCNCGKGAAIRTALKNITGQAVIIQDADLEYDPMDIPALLTDLEKSEVDAVYGSRELHPERRGYPHYVLGVKFLTALVNLRFGSRLTDVYTGYKLLRANILKSLDLEGGGFEIEMELTVKLLKGGVRIKEVPIHYYPRQFKEGKKIRFRDAVKGLITFLRFSF